MPLENRPTPIGLPTALEEIRYGTSPAVGSCLSALLTHTSWHPQFSVPSFSCLCAGKASGLHDNEEDGMTCSDIVECIMGSEDCAIDACCTNTVGSFSCACHSGHEGTGRRAQASMSASWARLIVTPMPFAPTLREASRVLATPATKGTARRTRSSMSG